jgi:hypothetical protein
MQILQILDEINYILATLNLHVLIFFACNALITSPAHIEDK